MLYPKSNKYREVFSLNGIWKLKTVEDDFVPVHEIAEAQRIPVPASFNEIVTDKSLKDYEGKVLYETTFSFPVNQNKLYRLRIGATSHKCEVYLNGEKIGVGINGY
jgi:beta-glucuronidase